MPHLDPLCGISPSDEPSRGRVPTHCIPRWAGRHAGRSGSTEVDNLHVSPVLLQILRDEAAVAVFSCLFTAKQDGVGDFLLDRHFLYVAICSSVTGTAARTRPTSSARLDTLSTSPASARGLACAHSPCGKCGAGSTPRSSRLAKPASWETLLSLISMRRFAPESCSKSKKDSADFFVNPIV